MENFARDFIDILQYLLPGFVAAWIFYGLTPYPKPSQFERVVQALIFTLFIGAILSAAQSGWNFAARHLPIAKWDDPPGVVLSTVLAIALGLLFAYLANNDMLHKGLRKLRITRETSFPSEWFGAFREKQGGDANFLVIHFKDGRRLYGWPLDRPTHPTEGHFVMEYPAWFDESTGREEPIPDVKKILIGANDVEWVEFLTRTKEETDG